MPNTKDSPQKAPWYIRYFVPILIFLGLAGGIAALWIPANTGWLRQSGLPADAEQKAISDAGQKAVSDLRLHLLYVTGGVIAVLTLLQTNWKNKVDHRKVEADIQKNEQDAKNEAAKREQDAVKNKRDHIRQVHAERRSRYTKAVEQLANENAAVRLGGVYTLVGLVDEWLADDTLGQEEQQKEGQVIINNLCSYIRSPFPLAEEIEEYEARKELEKLQKTESEKLSEEESSRLQVLLKRFKDSDEYEKPKDITTDYAKFHEEQDVRRTIFVEMSKRSNAFSKIEKGEVFKTTRGIWGDFDFDFSRAPVFYPLGNLTIEKGNFSSAKFYSNTNFSRVKFAQNADFSWATFTQNTDFSRVKFAQNADFSRATFTQNTDFSWAAFTQNATFSEATFTQNTDFRKATFTQNTDFRKATFNQNATFSEVSFMQNANFNAATFTKNADFRMAIFTQCANFSEATLTQNATFSEVSFMQNANFSEVCFMQNANFNAATFTKNAEFKKATFNQKATFGKVAFGQNVTFKKATFKKQGPIFALGNYRARFSVRANPKNRSFATNLFIPMGKATLDGVECFIPVGTVLYDPDSWNKEKQYYRQSRPAKSDNYSSNQEKNKTK